MAAASNSADTRLERIFAMVPREAFLGPGPWKIAAGRGYLETPSADPAYLYQNVLVALDAEKSINNGEPFLHAAWIGAVAPEANDTISHIGTGTGYYTALLSMLALPGGRVHAFEIDEDLALQAKANLEPFERVSMICGDATALPLPESDVIYINAGVVAPPVAWCKALRQGGRMIFPWQPVEGIGIALVLTRSEAGYAVEPLGHVRFIACVGASDASVSSRTPSLLEARSIRSVYLMEDRPPDDSAVAIFPDVWFSTTALSA